MKLDICKMRGLTWSYKHREEPDRRNPHTSIRVCNSLQKTSLRAEQQTQKDVVTPQNVCRYELFTHYMGKFQEIYRNFAAVKPLKIGTE